MDKRLIDLVENWDQLGWFDRKIVSWKCGWASRKIDIRPAISIAATLATIWVFIDFQETIHRIQLLIIVFLFYFYAISLDYLYQIIYKRGI